MTIFVISSNVLVLLSSLLAVLSLFYIFDKFLVPSAKEVTNINSYLPQLYHDRRQHVKVDFNRVSCLLITIFGGFVRMVFLDAVASLDLG